MANRNAPASFTFEEWRVEFNELATDVGDFESGITGSVPALTPTYNTVQSAIEGLVTDVNNIMNGTYTFSGATTTVTQDLQVNGDSTFTGDVTINGNLQLGNQDTDSITLVADLASNLIPDADNTYDIGSSPKSWKDLYLDGVAYINGTTGSTSSSTGALIVAGGVGIGENLNIAGDVTISGNLTQLSNGSPLVIADQGFSIAISIALS
jgi:hypothetical protein